jgi:Glycosyl hydrolase family 30 beta sandwich domain
LATFFFGTKKDYVAVVVLNTADTPVTFKLQSGNQAAKILIPEHAIATYLYANHGEEYVTETSQDLHFPF